MDTENNKEMMKEAEARTMNTIAKVHDSLVMWQGSQNLRAAQKKSCTQNKQMTAMGYISDTEEIINASWSLFQHDGAAALKIVTKISIATSFVSEEPPWRTNSNIESPPTSKNLPSSSRK